MPVAPPFSFVRSVMGPVGHGTGYFSRKRCRNSEAFAANPSIPAAIQHGVDPVADRFEASAGQTHFRLQHKLQLRIEPLDGFQHLVEHCIGNRCAIPVCRTVPVESQSIVISLRTHFLRRRPIASRCGAGDRPFIGTACKSGRGQHGQGEEQASHRGAVFVGHSDLAAFAFSSFSSCASDTPSSLARRAFSLFERSV